MTDLGSFLVLVTHVLLVTSGLFHVSWFCSQVLPLMTRYFDTNQRCDLNWWLINDFLNNYIVIMKIQDYKVEYWPLINIHRNLYQCSEKEMGTKKCYDFFEIVCFSGNHFIEAEFTKMDNAQKYCKSLQFFLTYLHHVSNSF